MSRKSHFWTCMWSSDYRPSADGMNKVFGGFFCKLALYAISTLKTALEGVCGRLLCALFGPQCVCVRVGVLLTAIYDLSCGSLDWWTLFKTSFLSHVNLKSWSQHVFLMNLIKKKHKMELICTCGTRAVRTLSGLHVRWSGCARTLLLTLLCLQRIKSSCAQRPWSCTSQPGSWRFSSLITKLSYYNTEKHVKTSRETGPVKTKMQQTSLSLRSATVFFFCWRLAGHKKLKFFYFQGRQFTN